MGSPLPNEILKTDAELDGYLQDFQDDLDPFCKWVPKGVYECQDLQLTIDDLLDAARRGKGRTGGTDSWTAGELLKLPRTRWELFTELWNTVLENGNTLDL